MKRHGVGILVSVLAVGVLAAPLSVTAAEAAGGEAEQAKPELQKEAEQAKPELQKKDKAEKKDRSNVDFVVTALPASLLVDVQGEKLTVAGERMSKVYMMPNIMAGVGMEFGDLYVDLQGGVGMIVNDQFQSFLLEAVLGASYAFTDSFNCGPRVGLLYLTDPDYTEDDTADFDEAAGLLVGFQMSMGDRIAYVVSVDLVMASMDVNADEGVVTSKDKLEISSLAFQFGVRGEF